ncbi:caspase family protein [Burkholderia cepacia]|uniref:caspase family protein n=1 Tax=Burkholderia cepacia TaxID=292 RepID=UPI002ABD899A|nr:caspase family protein [Burkholderia cepacia]
MNNRLALCIGNSEYLDAEIDNLPNAANDAQLIDSTLRARGFDSELLKNAAGYDIQQALARLKTKADAVGNAFAIIYFAGHGFEMGGLGFLVAADQPSPLTLSAIAQWGLSTLSLVDALAGCTGPKLIILDACREDAAEKASSNANELLRFSDAAKRLKMQFEGVLDTDDLVFAFATGAGKPAGDGVNGHSRYCEALASGMLSHDCTLNELLASVTQKVIRSTQIKQRPWYLSSLTSPVSLSDLPTFQAVPYEIYRMNADQFAYRVYAIGNGHFVYAVDRAVVVAYGHERRKFTSFKEEIATLATSGTDVYVLLKSGDVLHANIGGQSPDEFEIIHKAAFEDFHAMAVSPDGMTLAIGGMRGYEVVCRSSSEWASRVRQETPGHNIYNVKFFSNDRVVLCGSLGLVRDLHGIKSPSCELKFHDLSVTDMSDATDIELLKGGQELVVVCSNGLVVFVSLDTGAILNKLIVNNAELSLAHDYGSLRNNFTRDMLELYFGDRDAFKEYFADDPDLLEGIDSIVGRQSLVCCTRLQDDRILAIGSEEGFVFLFDARERALFRTLDVGGGRGINLRWLCADKHSDSFATLAGDGTMTRYVAIPPRF